MIMLNTCVHGVVLVQYSWRQAYQRALYRSANVQTAVGKLIDGLSCLLYGNKFNNAVSE